MNLDLYLENNQAQAALNRNIILRSIYEISNTIDSGDLVSAQVYLETARRSIKDLERLQMAKRDDVKLNEYMEQTDLRKEQIKGSQELNRQLEELIHAKNC